MRPLTFETIVLAGRLLRVSVRGQTGSRWRKGGTRVRANTMSTRIDMDSEMRLDGRQRGSGLGKVGVSEHATFRIDPAGAS